MTKNEIIPGLKNGYLHIRSLGSIYRNYKEVVFIAVKENGYALKYTSNELKNDKEIVLAAVQNNEQALQYASHEIQNEIGENNPVKYIESYFLKQKLNEKLINNNKIVTRKIKI